MSILGFGGRALIPDELLEGFGDPTDLMIRKAIPLGGWVYDAGHPNAWQTRLVVLTGNFAAAPSWLREQQVRCLIWQSAYDAIIAGIGRVGGTPSPNPNFVFRWRPRGSVDGTPWTEIPGEYLGVSLASVDSSFTSGNRLLYRVDIEDRRLNPSDPDYDAGTTALPADNTDIEFFLIGPMPPDEHHPIIIEGMTAGEFTANAYAGLYSERDPDTGAVVPTGIRYDEVAVKQMTAPVRFILTKPIEDLRDWLEKHIYQPHGFVPALDDQARISPVSQIPPTDISGLTLIDDDSAEATPDWSAGSLIINSIRFTYPRFYATDPPDPPPPFDGIPRQNVLEYKTIEIHFYDPLSVERFGEQSLEIDGLAFGAIGKVVDPADELDLSPLGRFILNLAPEGALEDLRAQRRATRPVTDQIVVVSGRPVVPIGGDVSTETGYQLAFDRYEHILNRYAFGAPTMRFPAMRSIVGGERAGSWVRLSLRHYPDYLTERRNLEAPLAQIVAMGEISCPWRQITVEIVGESTTS